MKQMSSYPVRISRSADIRKTLSATAGIYRRAVDFFISVCMEEWDTVSACKGQTGKVNAVEAFTVKTSKRKTVPYDFGKRLQNGKLSLTISGRISTSSRPT